MCTLTTEAGPRGACGRGGSAQGGDVRAQSLQMLRRRCALAATPTNPTAAATAATGFRRSSSRWCCCWLRHALPGESLREPAERDDGGHQREVLQQPLGLLVAVVAHAAAVAGDSFSASTLRAASAAASDAAAVAGWGGCTGERWGRGGRDSGSGSGSGSGSVVGGGRCCSGSHRCRRGRARRRRGGCATHGRLLPLLLLLLQQVEEVCGVAARGGEVERAVDDHQRHWRCFRQ